MRFHSRSVTHPAPSRGELGLLLGVLALVALALAGPHLVLPAHYHAFADQRSAFGIPCAMDVLSNLPFALAGAAGLWRLARMPANALLPAQRLLAVLFCVGLLVTTAGSSLYHWQPDDAGLALDRAGMGVAFAGLLGLAVAGRLSDRAGLALAGLILLLAPVAAGLPLLNGNMAPWAVLQTGALVLLGALMWQPVRPGAPGFSLGAVLAIYALAKGLELSDAAVFALTHGVVSGHSLKHLVAAGAALPVLLALWRASIIMPTGQNHGQTGQARPGRRSRRTPASRTA